MQAQARAGFVPLPVGTVVSTILGIAVAVIVLSVAANRSVPLISSDVAAFWVVAAVGVTMCTLAGVGQAPAALGWAHPYTLTGILFGTVAVVLMAMVLFGRTEALTSVASNLGIGSVSTLSGAGLATVGLGLVILVKWVLGFVLYLLRRSHLQRRLGEE